MLVSSIALLGLLLIFIKLKRLARLSQAKAAQILTLEETVAALSASFAGFSSNLGRVEQQLRRLAERQDQLEMRDPDRHSHQHAIKLARGGAKLEELIEVCGIVHDEAELLIRLHGYDSKKVVNFD